MSSVLPERLQGDAIVVFPPVSMNVATRSPCLSAPLLATYLQTNGVAAESLDLNTRFFRHLASREVFDDLVDRGRNALAVLDGKAQLSPAERKMQQGLKNLFDSTYLHDERPLLKQLRHEDHFGLFLSQGRVKNGMSHIGLGATGSASARADTGGASGTRPGHPK